MRKWNNVNFTSLNGPLEAIMVDLFVKLVELVCSQGDKGCVECQCTCKRLLVLARWRQSCWHSKGQRLKGVEVHTCQHYKG